MKEKFNEYDLINKEYEVIKEKRNKLKRKIDKEMKKAYKHAKEYFGLYLELGQSGILGARTISYMLQRYEKGEKTYQLYKDMMNIN